MFIMSHDEKKGPKSRSFALVALAWAFIGGQALLAAGSVCNLSDPEGKTAGSAKPWDLLGQSAEKMRTMAMQSQPDVFSNVAIFFAIANALGIIALMCALLSWSRSRHVSGKLTIAAAIAIILVNSLLNLPYA